MIDHWFGGLLDAARRQRAVGRHRGHRVHRPRPLPRREADGDGWTSGASRACRSTNRSDTSPLLIHWPGVDGGGRSCDALTTNVDLYATIADVFGVTAGAPHARPVARAVAHGRGRRRSATGRSAACYGNWVQVTDGRRKYARGPGRRQLPAVDVVEPLVDHAGARASRHHCAAHARRAGARSTSCPAATCR